MLKNRLTRLLLIILLVLAAITSGAYAYMVKVTSVKQNELIPAAVYCEVVEEFDGINKTSIQVQSKVEDANGDKISNIDVYIRVKLMTNWYKVDGEKYILVGRPSAALSLNLNADSWIAGSENTYYYKTPVKPGNLTENLLSQPLVLQEVKEDEVTYLQVVEVFAEAIQALGTTDADGTPAVTDAWGVTLDANGNITGFVTP